MKNIWIRFDKVYADETFIEAFKYDCNTVAEISKYVGCSFIAAKTRLEKLLKEGKVRREIKKAGKSYLYFLNN